MTAMVPLAAISLRSLGLAQGLLSSHVMKTIILAAALSIVTIATGCSVATTESDDPTSEAHSDAMTLNHATALAKDPGNRVARVSAGRTSIPSLTHLELYVKPGVGVVVRGVDERTNNAHVFEIAVTHGAPKAVLTMRSDLAKTPNIWPRMVETLREAARFPRKECIGPALAELTLDAVAVPVMAGGIAGCVSSMGIGCYFMFLTGAEMTVLGNMINVGCERS
ncbi:MAG: hypothetical protein NVS3B20_03210 [Polyangiales bacterium]